MEEELCDKENLSWGYSHSDFKSGLLSLEGTAHFISAPMKVQPTTGGYCNSPYMRTTDLRGKYLKDILDGKVSIYIEHVAGGVDDDPIKLKEFLRFVQNFISIPLRRVMFRNIFLGYLL